MSRRTKYILIIVGVLVVAGALTGVLLITGKNSADSQSGDDSSLSKTEGVQQIDTGTLTQATDVQQKIVNLETLARSFSERYGSHSNQSDFENLQDLFPFMTEQMSQSSRQYIDEQRARKEASAVYAGTITKALSVEFIAQAENNAVLRVATQRREIGGNTAEPRIYYQDLELAFVKVGEQWKVNKAEWK